MKKSGIFALLFVLISLIALARNPVKEMGRLQVNGTQLADQKGQPVRLTGVSLGWSCFHPRFYTAGTVSWLKNDWNVNVVRASMGIDPADGYLENPKGNIQRMETVIDAAIKEGIYVIIDWHAHTIHTAEAKAFFDRMSKKYSKYPNVIYEVFNEPEKQTWNEVKNYAEEVIRTIRKNDPDNVILVGCPEWDQRIDLVQKDPIKGVKNLMYTVHFYAATHGKWLRDRTDAAMHAGIPVFISESAGMEATGDGKLNDTEWQNYIDWMDTRKLSWITWSVSDKKETCSMLLPTASSDGNWKLSDLNESGIKTRDFLRQYDNRGNRIEKFHWGGRVQKSSYNKGLLTGPGSYVEFEFEGKSVDVLLKSVDTYAHHNWIALEVDGKYMGRIKIEPGDARKYKIEGVNRSPRHRVRLTKATESSNGYIEFDGTGINALPYTVQPWKKIEFIGDSITCGMGNDQSYLPCGQGEWFDQHNAYLAYGPVLARKLGADYLLSSVSGYGMYRNWNTERPEEPILPDVYGNLFLNGTGKSDFDNDYQPDIVSIALGTNDFSDGDGRKERLPFNSHKFIGNYIEFVQMIRKRYPNAQIVLLNSPMVSGGKNRRFVEYLNEVKDFFCNDTQHSPIQIFEFNEMTPKGCGYHPDNTDDAVMAQEMYPLFEKLLKE